MMVDVEVGLALGGGGNRCFAHPGVLRALEERGFRPAAVTACSSAAVIAAFHATSHSTGHILGLAREVGLWELLKLEVEHALATGNALMEFLERHLPRTFAELRLPLAVAAVDIQKGEPVDLRVGPLPLAICASCAVLGLFAPVKHWGRYLMDGGILNGVPVDMLRSLTLAPTVAVDIGQSIERELDIEGRSGLWTGLSAPLKGETPLALELMFRADMISRHYLVRMRHALYPSDLLIEPNLDEPVEGAEGMEALVTLGYQQALEALDQEGNRLRRSERG